MSEYGAADEIAKLADLKQRALLSEVEFEEQKARVLAEAKDGNRHPIPALAIIGASIAVVALVVGLVASTSSNSQKGTTGTNTVHLALASETSSDAAAANWVKSMVNSASGRSGAKYWYGCLALAVDAWGIGANHSIRSEVTVPITSNTYPSDIWNHFSGGTTGSGSSPPPGALVFWNSKGGRDDSHVAISIGGGELVSTNVDQPSVPGYNGIHEESMSQFASNSWNIYDGWWLPDGASAPPPASAAPAPAPAPTSTPATSPLRVSTSPSSSGSSSSSLQPTANSSTIQPAAGGSSAQPASGGGSSGGGTGAGAGASAPVPSTPAPTPATPATTPTTTTLTTSPAPATTYSETVGGVSHTWTNYSDAGGTEGPSIAPNQTVQIACKVTGFKVSDGNTWWYRIASSPWNNAYYVSADAFYNDGATSGSLLGTPFVDPAVPSC